MSEALGLRLRDVLREDLGGTYGVQVSGSFARRPYQGTMAYVQFTCAPENAQKMLDALWKEIRKIQAEGFSVDEVAKVKAAQTRALEEGLRTNDYWLDQLVNQYRFGSDPRFILEEKKLTEAPGRRGLEGGCAPASSRRSASCWAILEPAAPAAAAAAK